jgi:hypothetical protein
MAEHDQGVAVAVAGEFSPDEGMSIHTELSRRLAGFFRRVLSALHESRRREAELVVRRYADLVDYARAYPLALDDRGADARPAAGGG